MRPNTQQPWTGTDGEAVRDVENRTGLATVAAAQRNDGSLRAISKAVFLRNSVAYGDEDALAPAIANVARTHAVTLVSNTDGACLSAQGPAGINITPLCVTHGGSLLGRSETDNTKVHTLSSPFATWSATPTVTAPFGVTCAWTLAGGRIIFILADSVTHHAKAYYSDDNGVTLTASVVDGGTSALSASDGAFSICENSLVEVGGGCLFLGEYDTVGARIIYRSLDNGATWTTSYTSGAGMHWHSGAYHAATGKVVFAAGDGTYGRILSTSDPTTVAGCTWAVQSPVMASFQPTCLRDAGHPTCLYFGADGYEEGGLLDVSGATFTRSRRVVDLNYRLLDSAVWDIFQYQGVFYLSNPQTDATDGTDRSAVILVTVDWVHFGVAYRFSAAKTGTLNQGVKRFLGVVNGKIEARLISEDTNHCTEFRMSPVTLKTITAPIVEPAATNKLNTAAKSSFEGTIGDSGWVKSGTCETFEVVTSTHFGDPAETKCLHAKRTGDGSTTFQINAPQMDTYGANTGFTAGDVVQGRIRIKASEPGITCTLVFYDNTASANVGTAYLTVGPDWAEFETVPYVVPGTGGRDMGMCLVGIPSGVDVYIDYAAVFYIKQIADATLGPQVTYQIGGTARAAETLESASVRPASWTEVFHIFPRLWRKDIATATVAKTGNLYLRHWVTRGGYIALLYDTTNRYFSLVQKLAADGAETVVLHSVETHDWQRHADLKFAVGYNSVTGKLSLSVANGQAAVNVDYAATTLTDLGNAVVQTGPGGTNGTTAFGTTMLPQVVGPSVVYDTALSAANMATAMGLLELP